jgi:large subunit ribosomal protein L25
LIELDHNALWHALKKEAFHATILDMEYQGKESKVLLRDVQYHPYKQQVLHIDFQRVDAKTTLTMKVPLHFKGEADSPAVKTDNCLVNHVANDLQINCLPADLPEFIEIDLSGLKKGVSLHVKDLTLPKGVKAVTHGTQNPVIVSVVAQAAEEEAPAATAPATDAKGKDAKKAPPAKAPAAKK